MKKNIVLIASAALLLSSLFSSCAKITGCDELFEEGCVTTVDYTPVCGCNDKTYANKSFADCAGVDYVNGSCD